MNKLADSIERDEDAMTGARFEGYCNLVGRVLGMDGDDLEKQLSTGVKTQKESMIKYRRAHYQYARELGFTSQEAGRLQNWSLEKIKTLAEHKFKRKE